MKLRVTNTDIVDNTTLDTVIMPISEFCDLQAHPYLATAGFDYIVIDLDDKIPPGYLRCLIGKYRVIPRIVNKVTTDTARQLAELYPESAAKVRFSFIRNKGDISDVLKELSEKFKWNEYY